MDKQPTLFGLQGLKRRLIYVSLYELIAIAAATAGLALLSGQGAGHSSVVDCHRLEHRLQLGV